MTTEYNDKGSNFNKSNQVDEDIKIQSFTKEQLLSENIEKLADLCHEVSLFKNTLVSAILDNISDFNFQKFIASADYIIKEPFIKKTVKTSNLRGLNVLSVDGSSVIKNFMNMDFSFLKAIAVKYYFYKNQIAKIDYYPDIEGFNNYSMQGNFLNIDEKVIDSTTSIDMTFIEINLLNRVIENTNDIDIIIIDGSIIIMPINYIFSHDSITNKKYLHLVKEYQKLYENCRKKNILLIGSIKDTRTAALGNCLKRSITLLKPNYEVLSDFLKFEYRQSFDYFSDLDLFNKVLQKNERSCIFKCKKEIEKIRDIGIKRKITDYLEYDFYAFYLKTVKFDTPCRIEFFVDESHDYSEASQKADLIASLLLPISNQNEYYGLSIPQIEAHRRAVFKPSEINLIFNSLKRSLSHYGVEIIEKRRSRRPF